MIRVPCRACGGILEVPEELAGTEFQCPHCKLLSDIPTLHELKQLKEDGTYVLDDAKREEDPYRLAEMIHVWGKDKTDETGEDIDLRGPTAEEEKLYHVADEPHVKPPPKYDPETGELIKPLDVKPDPGREPIDPRTIPMAQPALGYADQTTTQAISTRSAFMGLGRPINIVVICVVFLFHLSVALVLIACAWLGYFIGIPFMFIVLLMLIAHWGNVVDDIGRQEKDEIPRPFRDMQWYEDLCQPLVAMALSMFICYGPELILRHYLHTPRMQLLLVPLWLAQSFFFPAIFLITTTSGSIEHLRPDRIWGTISRSRGAYAMSVALWTIAGLGYTACLVMMFFLMEWAAFKFPPLKSPWKYIIRWEYLLPMLMVTVYLMHLFCWQLGLIYREHHAMFPWAYQYHKRKYSDSIGAARLKGPRKPPIPRQKLKATVAAQIKTAPAAPPIAAPAPTPAPAPAREAKGQWPQIQ